MRKVEQVEECLNMIEDIIPSIFSKEKVFDNIEDVKKKLFEILLIMMNDFVYWNNRGVEIPVDLIMEQVENMNIAFMKKDRQKLVDSLLYEIANSLLLYRDLLLECEEK